MNKTRRGFLAIAGGSLLGAPLLKGALAATEEEESSEAAACVSHKWAMVIDLGKCNEKKDCTACQAACHAAHNVPFIDNVEEEIKWIWKEGFCNAFQERCHEHMSSKLKEASMPVLCNHCENPPCVKVCPTKATWKRESDGIVMMDMHRCIGCRYCVVGCPYGSRSFNWRDPRPHIANIRQDFPTRTKGVVEKCNFCEERLAKGREPACVEASRQEGCNAIAFGDLLDPDSEVRRLLQRNNTIRRKPELGTSPMVYYIV
jgi:molybdopterin-containing oxidoreductase family iron-sulfur binding subunit